MKIKIKENKNRLLIIIGILFIFCGISLFFINKLYFYCINKEEEKAINGIVLNNKKSVVEEVNLDDFTSNNITKENKEESNSYSYIGVLEIPKINFKKGFLNIDDRNNRVSKNIQVIRESDMPNIVNGNLIIAGHSGNSNSSFFNDLNKLKYDDKAIIYYDNYKYIYRLSNIYNIDKKGYAKITRLKNETALSLITCSKTDKTKQIVFIFYLEERVII